MDIALTILGILVVLFVILVLAGRPLLDRMQANEARRALDSFRLQREQLEAKFFDIASRLGKPRGLKWLECEWQDRVEFGRDIENGMLTAFVAVNLNFEAIEGGDMEDVEAVGMMRDAAALFHFQGGAWGTGGRALFNMNPEDALDRLKDQYSPVEIPT
jgi:hypothetical protein